MNRIPTLNNNLELVLCVNNYMFKLPILSGFRGCFEVVEARTEALWTFHEFNLYTSVIHYYFDIFGWNLNVSKATPMHINGIAINFNRILMVL
jgi:hypothetical protein